MIFVPVKRLLLFLWMVVFPVLLFAQSVTDTILIQEVTVTGDRIFKKEEAGIKTTRVDSMVMVDKITVSLSEVLSQNTTVFIKDHGRGALATASFRGTAPSHTQVFWNGLTINSPMLGMTDFSLIPAFIADDMQLKHGAASLSSGSGGMGGSISIQNTPGWDNRISWRYYQTAGSYSTYDEFFQFNIGNRKFQSKSRVYLNDSENDYEYVNKAILERPVVKNDNADYHKKGAMQEFYFRPGEQSVASLKAWGQISDRSLPSVMSYEGDDRSNLNSQKDTTLKVVAEWSSYLGPVKLSARSGIDYQLTNYRLQNYISGVGLFDAINSSSRALSWCNHAEIENGMEERRFAWKAAFDFSHFDVRSHETVDQTGYDKVRNDASFFGGAYYHLAEWLNLSLMLRNDYIERQFSPLMFDAGASFRPFLKKNLILKANISRNTHHPSLNDLYWQPGGNPELLPEESYTGEISVEHYIETSRLSLEQALTPYYSDIDNWIIWLPSNQGYWQPFNLKKVKSYGLEYHVKYVQQMGRVELQLHGNYALTKSLNYGERQFLGDGSYGKQLPFLPVHSGNVLVSVAWKGFYLRFQNNSYSERFTLSSNEVGVTDDSEEIGASVSTNRLNWYYPYFMNDLTLGKDFYWKKYQIGVDLKVNNLFDEEYRSVLGRYMPGRNYEVLIKIRYRK